MDDPLHHGSLEPDGMPFTVMPAMPATTQGLASGGTQLITDTLGRNRVLSPTSMSHMTIPWI